MFVRLTAIEMMPLVRGMAACVLLIVIGVTTAEHQLNGLTLQNAHVRSFNIKRVQGIYSIHILGNSISGSALYPIASLEHSRQQIIISNNSRSLIIPIMIQIDMQKTGYWLSQWRKQFVDEAFKTKESFSTYFRELEPILKIANHWINEQIKRIRQMLAGSR